MPGCSASRHDACLARANRGRQTRTLRRSPYHRFIGTGQCDCMQAIAVLSFGLIANLLPLMTFAATLPSIAADWGLTAGEAGWIGGVYFAGYAACVPILASATDRIDGRWLYAACAVLGAVASFAFALGAEGFLSGLVLRLIGGAA